MTNIQNLMLQLRSASGDTSIGTAVKQGRFAMVSNVQHGRKVVARYISEPMPINQYIQFLSGEIDAQSKGAFGYQA